MKSNTNMYKFSVEQWSPSAGCEHACDYCAKTFQRQLKRWAKKNCPECYRFAPHEHPERLSATLPRTDFLQFIFTCSSGDVAFCPTPFLKKIVDRIEKEHHDQDWFRRIVRA